MKPKTLLTVALWAFVAACLVTLGAKEWQRRARSNTAAYTAPSLSAPLPEGERGGTATADRLIVYCFHRTVRCKTCLDIEAYTREALQTAFADRLDDGSLDFRPTAVDQPETEHFQDDFQLVGPAVVLVAMHGGKIQKWENLLDVVPLLTDKTVFMGYVEEHVRKLLEK